MGLRTNDFKLGQFHGKVQAENNESEANIQRIVFLNQKIRIRKKQKESIDIRIFGYEVPLKKDCKRGECVDLMGYDEEKNLYLIELKDARSKEKLSRVIEQITEYEKTVAEIKKCIEDDFKKTFLLPIEFKEIKKIILAPREFYEKNEKEYQPNMSIKYCYFRNKDIHERKPGQIINIHIWKGNKWNL